uniref:FA core complex associated protein 20 n=1 Tax=Equus asinus TaxID=9793 RepID=A0A9L0JDN8_EQUAS
MEAARRPRLRLSRRRPPSGGESPGAALSAPRPPRSSPSDLRPFPGRPSRRPCGEAVAALTGCSARPGGARGPPTGPRKDAPRPSPAGPPAPRSSRRWRAHRARRPCAAALCARLTSTLGWPRWTSIATSLSAWQKAQTMWCGELPTCAAWHRLPLRPGWCGGLVSLHRPEPPPLYSTY